MARQRASVPHVRFYASDWLAGTAQLSAVERGVYITLLALFWDSDGRLENNTRRLATACGMRIDHFEKALQGLIEAGKIEIRGNYVFNFRAEIELIEARTARVIEHQKQSDKGRLSATKRGELRAEKSNENNEGVQPNQEPRTKNQKEEEREDPPTPQTGGSVTRISDADRMVEIWNTMAKANGLATCRHLTPERRRRCLARLRDLGGIDGWGEACAQVPRSSFLTGGGARGWRANLDFMLRPNKAVEVLEGVFDDHKDAGSFEKFLREVMS